MLVPWKKSYDQPRHHIKRQRHYFTNKGPSSQSYGFPVVLYRCESWTVKNAECQRNDAFWTVVLEKTLGNPLDCKEIHPVNCSCEYSLEYWNVGIQSWISLEGLMLKLKLPILWPPDAKNWLTRKDPDAGKDWRREEKGTTEDEMAGWHHWLDGHEFE